MDSGFQQRLLGSYSDSDIVRYVLNSPPLTVSPCRIVLLSSELVAKRFTAQKLADELAAISLARQLYIRVPLIKRVVEDSGVAYVIMERIHGVTLEESWDRIGWITTLHLAFQLRHFVCKMRTCTSSTAGSLVRGTCDSIWLDDYYKIPPHATPEAITQFLIFWLRHVPTRRKVSASNDPDGAQRFVPSTSPSLVFTHQDLAPRNLIADRDGKLWLVDWEFSGWYPKYFESVSMQNFWTPASWNWAARVRWWIFSWISVGIYGREREALKLVRSRFIRNPLGRRDEVLQPGAHFDAMDLRKPGM
ncbi:MAG: hypothetical protein Q9172_003618 [Xanthocarpia lactea]